MNTRAAELINQARANAQAGRPGVIDLMLDAMEALAAGGSDAGGAMPGQAGQGGPRGARLAAAVRAFLETSGAFAAPLPAESPLVALREALAAFEAGEPG